MPILTVSLAQMQVKAGDPRSNWTTVRDLTAEAVRRGSDLIVLPELWDSGYALDRAKELASSLSTGLFAEVATLSKTSNIHILGSMLEKRGVGVYNSTAVFSPRTGVMGVYRKIHLFGLFNEPQYLSPGESPLTVDLPWGVLQLQFAMICGSRNYSVDMQLRVQKYSSCLLNGHIHDWRIGGHCFKHVLLKTRCL